MKIDTFEVKAINQLAPNADFRTGNGKIIWDSPDIPQPSEADIITKANELEAEYDAQEYSRDRSSSYPSVGDQLDMLMKDMKNGTTTHQEACEAVKDKYPKP